MSAQVKGKTPADRLSERMRSFFGVSLEKLRQNSEPAALITSLEGWVEEFRIEGTLHTLSQSSTYERYRKSSVVMTGAGEKAWKRWREQGGKEAESGIYPCRLDFPGRTARVSHWVAWDRSSLARSPIPGADINEFAFQADAIYAAMLASEWELLDALAAAVDGAARSLPRPG